MKTLSKNLSKVLVAVVIVLALGFMLGIGLAGAEANAAASDKTVTVKVAQLSDTHVLPTKLCNPYSEAFKKANNGTKLLNQSEAAFETALNQIYLQALEGEAPTYIIITGDLTSDGEVEANKYLAKTLTDFTRAMRAVNGYEKFQVLVTPGNHDLYNDGSKTFMPSEEELAGKTPEEAEEIIRNYPETSVATTTAKDFFEIYKDFGYCNCDGRKEGRHDATCGMAEGTKLTYFYESEDWYTDKNPVRTNTASGVKYEGFDTEKPTAEEQKAFKESNKDFEYLARAGKIGINSFVAEFADGVVFLSVDANARNYVGEEKSNFAAMGWDETTGGMVPRNVLRWLLKETDRIKTANDEAFFFLSSHFNLGPHFKGQDEVISLFVLDNWEQFTSSMANAGVRYAFSGHQHSSDIWNYVTQEGNVMYDFESGSLISYGSSYKEVTFNREWKNGAYSETCRSNIIELMGNNADENNPVFYYDQYVLSAETAGKEVLGDEGSGNVVASWLIPDAENDWDTTRLYGLDALTLVKVPCLNNAGEPTTIGDYLAEGLSGMISGMAKSYVNDGLYDMLRGFINKLGQENGDFAFTKAVVSELIDGLETLDLYKLTANKDYTAFTMSAEPQKGYHLVEFAEDLVDYLFNYDFSYGQVEGKLKATQLLVEVYAGHLSGAAKNVSDEIKPLLENLRNGGFMRFLINTLMDSVMPQLELILDAPIRVAETAPAIPEGKGFDVAAALKTKGKGTVDNIIKAVVNEYAFTEKDSDGHSSVNLLLKSLSTIVKDVLTTNPKELKGTLKTIAQVAQNALKNFPSIAKYADLGLNYLNKYFEKGSLSQILQEELLDKYVTDAFCKNIGEYGAYLIANFMIDDIPDGAHWDPEKNKFVQAATVPEKDFVVTCVRENGREWLQGKYSYYCDANGNDKLTVTPTRENGMLPGLISVSYSGDVTSNKKIQWFTSIESNVFDKNAAGEYEYSVPESYIKYSAKADMSDASVIKVSGENVERELPTIDLGIIYFNLSHRYKLYNKYTAELTDLTPGTTYYYSVGSDKYGWTKPAMFATAKASGGFAFTAITDVQGSVEKNYIDSYGNLKKAVGSGTDFILSCGDNVDNGKNIMQYTWWLDGQSDVWTNNTLVTLAGNHEKKNYSLSSVIATPDEAIINETGYYYSYDYQNVHFVILDTNDLGADNALSAAQTEWLVADLKKANESEKIDFIVVSLHKGPYTAGSHAFDEDVIALRHQLTPIFADNNVDLVLQGHDHTYSVSERLDREGKKSDNGVLYINLGTMGDKYYNYIYSDEVSIIKRTSVDPRIASYLTEDGYLELTETPCFLKVEVDGKKFVVKSYTIVNGEEVLVDDIDLSKGGSLSTGAIVGITVAAVAVAAIVVLVIVFAVSKKKKKIA